MEYENRAGPLWHEASSYGAFHKPLVRIVDHDRPIMRGAESAARQRFEWRNITGSMILITSQTWRAQHRPERCFEVYGLSLDDSHTYLVTPDFPLRFVSLSYGNGRGSLSATYWFQSVGRTTDDYGTRIWADLAPKRDRWVLVTILFDGVHDPSTADLQAFYLALHDGVVHSLEGGSK